MINPENANPPSIAGLPCPQEVDAVALPKIDVGERPGGD